MISNEEILLFNEKIAKLYTKITTDLDELEELIQKMGINTGKEIILAIEIRQHCPFNADGLLAHVINLQEFLKGQLAEQEGIIAHLKSGKDILSYKAIS